MAFTPLQPLAPTTSTGNFTPMDATPAPAPVAAPTIPQPTIGSAGETVIPGSNFMSNIKQLPGQLLGAGKAAFNALPGKQLGAAVGTSVESIGRAVATKSLAPIEQGNRENAANFGPIVGDIVQSAALPASLAAGGGVGESAAARIGSSALKYGVLGAAGAGGNTAAQGGSPTDTAISAGKGLIGGALGGAAAQGLGEAVGALSKAPAADQQLADALTVTKPTLNKQNSIAAFERAGQPGGATKTGLLGNYDVAPSPHDTRIAQSVADVVTPKQGPIDNIASINNKIENVSENEIRPFLQENPAAFNLKQLNSYIADNTAVPNYIKADPVLQKTYDLTRESMMEEAANQPKTMEGLWDARKSFDHVAERQGIGLNPTDPKRAAIKQAVLDTRRAVNDYIAENTSKVAQEKGLNPLDFSQRLRDLSNMYEARGNIAEANYKLLGKNALTQWIKQNPAKAHLIEYGVGAVGLGGLASLGYKAL